MSTQTHAQAVLDLLAADVTLIVCDGVVPRGTTQPYVLTYIQAGPPRAGDQPDKSNLNFDSIARTVQIVTHSVGETAAAARVVGGRVEAQLLDVTPVVAGRTCSPIRWADGQPPSRDERTGELITDQVDVWEFTSTPA